MSMGKMSRNKDRIPLPSIPRPLSPSVTTVAMVEMLNKKNNKEMAEMGGHITCLHNFYKGTLMSSFVPCGTTVSFGSW